MGIKGFPQYLNKHFHFLFEAFSESSLKNARVAIDIGGYMHMFTEKMSYPTEYVDRFLAFTDELRRLGVKFVYVFDGIVAISKADTLNERRRKREITNRNIDAKIENLLGEERRYSALFAESMRSGIGSLLRLLRTLHCIRTERLELLSSKNPVNRRFFYVLEAVFSKHNVPYLVADMEAEKACAWLAVNGHVDIVISEDYDTLLCGAPVMLRRWRSDSNDPCTVSLAKLLGTMNLSYPDFVTTCVLAGTDFAKPPPSFGFRRAMWSVRETISARPQFSFLPVPPPGQGIATEPLSAPFLTNGGNGNGGNGNDGNGNDGNGNGSPDAIGGRFSGIAVLRQTFDRVYRGAYATPELADAALASFEVSYNIFTTTAFPFTRCLRIVCLVWLACILMGRLSQLPFSANTGTRNGANDICGTLGAFRAGQ